MTYEDSIRKEQVGRMQSALQAARWDRDRARALDSLGALLKCETPGTVSTVAVKRNRWRFWNPSRETRVEAQEIVLSDDERREFAAWCAEWARKLKARAEETEAKIAAYGVGEQGNG